MSSGAVGGLAYRSVGAAPLAWDCDSDFVMFWEAHQLGIERSFLKKCKASFAQSSGALRPRAQTGTLAANASRISFRIPYGMGVPKMPVAHAATPAARQFARDRSSNTATSWRHSSRATCHAGQPSVSRSCRRPMAIPFQALADTGLKGSPAFAAAAASASPAAPAPWISVLASVLGRAYSWHFKAGTPAG